MSRRVRDWCDICRDINTNVKCQKAGCSRKFHEWCLRMVGEWDGNAGDYVCQHCTAASVNDSVCYICDAKISTNKQSSPNTDDGVSRECVDLSQVLLCDGCTNSVHIDCLDVKDPPIVNDNELWYCPQCDPHGETAIAMDSRAKSSQPAVTVDTKVQEYKNKIGGNVDICYVCQKGGRLLGCDYCEQSYHPRCIDSEFLEFENGEDKWQCMLCRGEDPLKSFGNRRLSRTAMARLMNEMQTCIKAQYKSSKHNRDSFLWQNRFELRPFLTDKANSKLNKQFSAIAKGSINDTDTEEDEHPTTSLRTNEENCMEYYENAEKQSNHTMLKEGVKLKDYQKMGVGWLLQSFFHRAGAILADEMGLGKTIQCLTFLSALKALGITGPHMIVVPLSTVGNWAREIRRFVPHLVFVKISGSRFERDHIMSDPIAAQGLHDLYITTYETIVTEESFFCDNFDWQCIILDEAHRIKNESGRIRHSLDRVCANMRVLLTGTPLQNNVKELFTLLNFLFPEILQNSEQFEKLFCKAGVNSKELNADETIESTIDKSAILGVSHLLKKMMLRRTKDLVVKLPRKIEHDIWIPLSQDAAYWYKKLLDVSEAAFQADSVRRMLGAVIKMRICTCHPRGLVSHDSQLKKFKEAFQIIGNEEKLEADANALLAVQGEDHIAASNKLLVLDKLLVQLHLLNCMNSESYYDAYIQNIKNLYITKNPLPPILPPKQNEGRVRSTSEKQLSNRQIAERARRERIALAHVQAKEYENKITLIAKEQYEELKKLFHYEPWLEAAMHCVPQHILESSDVGSDHAEEEDLDESANDDKTQMNDIIGHPLDLATELDSGGNAMNKESSEEDGNRESYEASGHKKTSTLSQEEGHRCIEQIPGTDTTSTLKTPAVGEGTKIERDDLAMPKTEKLIHKVLIFTQFQLVLDELQAYCQYRGLKYLRLDGNTNKMIRELDIREFNSHDSTHLVYLICTRAGGVGINLVTANHVVLFDEDWNPFLDLQAIDRAHRIGQKRDVHVWKLITEWSVEERMAFRRMQKLQLDKLFIQGAKSEAEEEEIPDGEAQAAQKMNVDEVKRLIRHGREAVKTLLIENESIGTYTLAEIMARPRKNLPATFEEELLRDVAEPDDETAEAVTVTLDEDSTCTPGGTSCEFPDNIDNTTEDADAELDSMFVNKTEDSVDSVPKPPPVDLELGDGRRPRRLRKKIQLAAAPAVLPARKKEEKKILHDKKCFKCGSGNNSFDENADPLIPCHRCPRVFHMAGCLNMSEPPKRTWACQWHECCLCFRRGSQAGGMLIHCAECPTTFCFDCFPPEYRRYTPPATYFSDFNRRGYNVSFERMVLFLCSRCKALKEQQRRRLLSKQQMEVEMRKRREAQAKARADAERERAKDVESNAATALALALSKRGGDIKKNFLAKKKQIDEQDKAYLNRFKNEYERLFPQVYLDCLEERRQTQVALRDEILEKADARGKGSKSIISRTPKEFVRVCENCHFPAHDASACPFPAEANKRTEDSVPDGPATTETAGDASAPALENDSLEYQQEFAAIDSVTGTLASSSGVSSGVPGKKTVLRSFCPKCGVSSRNHLRRHCALLTEEESAEYGARRLKQEAFLAALAAEAPIEADDGIQMHVENVDNLRKLLQREVDIRVAKCLRESNLAACVAPSRADGNQSASSKTEKTRRKRTVDDGTPENPVTTRSGMAARARSKLNVTFEVEDEDAEAHVEHAGSSTNNTNKARTANRVNETFSGEPREADHEAALHKKRRTAHTELPSTGHKTVPSVKMMPTGPAPMNSMFPPGQIMHSMYQMINNPQGMRMPAGIPPGYPQMQQQMYPPAYYQQHEQFMGKTNNVMHGMTTQSQLHAQHMYQTHTGANPYLQFNMGQYQQHANPNLMHPGISMMQVPQIYPGTAGNGLAHQSSSQIPRAGQPAGIQTMGSPSSIQQVAGINLARIPPIYPAPAGSTDSFTSPQESNDAGDNAVPPRASISDDYVGLKPQVE